MVLRFVTCSPKDNPPGRVTRHMSLVTAGSDSRNITTVIKGGKVFDPGAIEKALGISPRK